MRHLKSPRKHSVRSALTTAVKTNYGSVSIAGEYKLFLHHITNYITAGVEFANTFVLQFNAFNACYFTNYNKSTGYFLNTSAVSKTFVVVVSCHTASWLNVWPLVLFSVTLTL